MARSWTWRRRVRFWWRRFRRDPHAALEGFAAAAWKHPHSTSIFILSAAVVCASLWIFQPPPGVAAAFLAVGAVVFSLGHMSYSQKWLAVVVSMLLFGIEIHNIYADRAKHDAEFHQMMVEDRRATDRLLAADRSATKSILDHSDKQFAQTEQRFANVSGQASKELAQSGAELARTSGKDSFAYVVPFSFGYRFGLSLAAHGPNPLTNVSVLMDHHEPPTRTARYNEAGVYPGEVAVPLDEWLDSQLNPIADKFDFWINGPSGEYHEALYTRGQMEKRQVRFVVWRARERQKRIAQVPVMCVNWWDGHTLPMPVIDKDLQQCQR